MKCRNCGADIPDDQLLCSVCGQEIQMVPDYNPLDDVITTQVRDALGRTMSWDNQELADQDLSKHSVDSKTRAMSETQYRRMNRNPGGQNRSSGNVKSQTGRGQAYVGKTKLESSDIRKRSQGQQRQDSRMSNTSARKQAERRKIAERKRQLARKKRARSLMIFCGLLVIALVMGIFLYQNSYRAVMKKGYQAVEAGRMDEAKSYFKKAIKKDKKKQDAYRALCELLTEEGMLDQAEDVFLDAIEGQPSNINLYRGVFKFYMDSHQEQKISELLAECKDSKVVTELQDYVSEPPTFSLDEKETYQDVQALELTSDGEAIYYTTDGSDPTTSSTKYTEPIVLNQEKTEVRAISVNEKGVPSLAKKKVFHIEFPDIMAPNVTPSTGQYDTWQTITVEEKEGCEIRYTTDGTIPDEKSILYTEPIEMPSGSCIFTFVYIDAGGRISQSTTRSYNLVVE